MAGKGNEGGREEKRAEKYQGRHVSKSLPTVHVAVDLPIALRLYLGALPVHLG